MTVCKVYDSGIIKEIYVVNHKASGISVMVDCKPVTKIWRNFIVCVKILSLFWKMFTNLTSRDSNRVNVPEVLWSADISRLASVTLMWPLT